MSVSIDGSSGITNMEIIDSSNNETHHSVIPSTLALICGGIAGTTVDVCLYPIDTLKTRLQSSQGFWKAGGFRGIYNGVSAAFMGSAPGASLFFVTYETMKPFIHNLTKNFNTSDEIQENSLAHMISAGCGEVAACCVRVPTEVVKQRMQTGQYTYFSQAIKTIYRTSNVSGFYVGYGTTVFREIPFAFIQFPLWERLKNTWSNLHYDGKELPPYQGALCGSLSGSVAAACTTPLDVIKTRLMLNTDGKYSGFVDCGRKIINEEGVSAFFKGIQPRVFWIFTGGFFFFGAYEKSKSLIRPIYETYSTDN